MPRHPWGSDTGARRRSCRRTCCRCSSRSAGSETASAARCSGSCTPSSQSSHVRCLHVYPHLDVTAASPGLGPPPVRGSQRTASRKLAVFLGHRCADPGRRARRAGRYARSRSVMAERGRAQSRFHPLGDLGLPLGRRARRGGGACGIVDAGHLPRRSTCAFRLRSASSPRGIRVRERLQYSRERGRPDGGAPRRCTPARGEPTPRPGGARRWRFRAHSDERRAPLRGGSSAGRRGRRRS